MSCTDCGVTELALGVTAANDDKRCIGCDLMGPELWTRYVQRWNPMQWVPQCLRRKRRMA